MHGVYSGIQDTLKKLGRLDLKVTNGKALFTLSEAQEIADVFKQYGLNRSADILLEWVGKDVRSRQLTPEIVFSELQRSVERELRASIFIHIEESRRKADRYIS